MHCSFCGWLIDEEHTRFCPQCGTLLAERPSEAPYYETRTSTSIHGAPTRISTDTPETERPRWGNNDGQPSPNPDHPPTPSSFHLAKQTPRERPNAPTERPPHSRQRGRILATLALIVIVAAGAGLAGYALGRQGSKTAGTPGATATTPRSLTPTATAVETVVFSDPLTSAAHSWPQDNTHCLFQDGSYHILKDYICLAPVGISGDANISVQIRPLNGAVDNFFGIVFRYTNTNDYYEFRINSNSLWFMDKYVNGSPTVLVPHTVNAAIKPGLSVVNTLLVRAHGTHLQFFVNGIELGQLNDSTFSSGEIGLRGPSPGPADTIWNNFQITSSNY